MISPSTPLLTKTIKVLFLFFLVLCGLYFGRSFLIPIAFAGILAMLFLPLSRRIEKKGINKALAAISCILILLTFFAGVGALLAWQISDLAGDVTQMEKRITDGIGQLRSSLSNTLGISPEKQQEIIKKQQSSGTGGIASTVTTVMGSLMSILTDALIVLIYIFLFFILPFSSQKVYNEDCSG